MGALYLRRSTPFAANAYSKIEFFIHGGSYSNVPLQVGFYNFATNQPISVRACFNYIHIYLNNSAVQVRTVPTAVVANQWVTVSMPVSKIINNNKINKRKKKKRNNNKIFLIRKSFLISKLHQMWN